MPGRLEVQTVGRQHSERSRFQFRSTCKYRLYDLQLVNADQNGLYPRGTHRVFDPRQEMQQRALC